MLILPVIDLLGGQVVRGVAGQRQNYRPVESILTPLATPAAVAAAFAEKLKFTHAYIADLDAIAGQQPAWGDYRAIAAAGLRLWVDAGVDAAQRACELYAHAGDGLARVVLGLETLSGPQQLLHIARQIDPRHLAFSLDLRDGRPLSDSPAWAGMSPLEIAASAYDSGIRNLIILDLARVGVGEGTGTLLLCREIHEHFPDIQLVAGGGVRNVDDLRVLSQSGASAALVASALHDGRITLADIEQAEEFTTESPRHGD